MNNQIQLETAQIDPTSPLRYIPRAALTRRERQLIELVVEGHSNRAIAARLALSPQTVKNQLSVIYDKTGVTGRVQLAVFAVMRQFTD